MLLTGLSVSGVGYTYAAYTTYAAAQDSARVAKFRVEMTGGDKKNLSLDGIEDKPTDSYSFTVKSDSEVAVDADLVLTLSQALPEGVTMTFVGPGVSTATESITVPEPVVTEDTDVVTYTFEKFAHFDPPTETTKQFWLVFTGGDHGSIKESRDINFNLSVTMSQVE